eukprot:CAMPEP_0206287574 /NCGR_PEP_ID=MMETSP0106_2-20121207/1177_1 /ASSEMBLY_ACC=CAM_ASM_000206 /TAXON_ID=81532 /ORGANISM="Acanthoeca-like sp., Strain 10tr" /LENGTH=424 /DNA_ID=CAMNT_0053718113 /DNA_START=267 /DNA_END=1538 /DNA_ORIENTATION=-
MRSADSYRWAGWAVSLAFVVTVLTLVTITHKPLSTRPSKESTETYFGDLATASCKTATTAHLKIQCCAEASSDDIALTATPLDRHGENVRAEVWQGDGLNAQPPVARVAGMMHVLVTGGAGYIGSHAVLRLLDDGHAVTIVDNLSRGNRGAINVLKKIAAPQQLRFVFLDLGQQAELTQLFFASKFDVVIHFAAVAYVAESYQDPLLYYNNVSSNTRHVLEAMKASGVKRIVYSSTCATYGNPKTMPIRESTPQKPVSPYGSAKLIAEQMIKWYTYSDEEFGAIILRYFNVIGADPLGRLGEFPTAAIATKHGRISGACFNTALGNIDSMSIMGTDHPTKDGTTVRDYIHVVDLVDAHVKALTAFRKSAVRVYNVGIGKGYSVREFVDACVQVTGVNITVVERERRAGDASIVYADPTKVAGEL